MTEEGVSSVLGSVLMLSIMVMLIPGALLMKQAVSEEMNAQREAAERAAWCARHPEVKAPTCPARGPLPGYQCREVQPGAWVCSDEEGAIADIEERLNGSSMKDPTSPTPVVTSPALTAPTLGP